MEVTDIIQIVSTLGFPIVMCGALFWYMVNKITAHQDTINKNTKVLTELTILIKILTDEKKR